jgi:hypothetical protein
MKSRFHKLVHGAFSGCFGGAAKGCKRCRSRWESKKYAVTARSDGGCRRKSLAQEEEERAGGGGTCPQSDGAYRCDGTSADSDFQPGGTDVFDENRNNYRFPRKSIRINRKADAPPKNVCYFPFRQSSKRRYIPCSVSVPPGQTSINRLPPSPYFRRFGCGRIDRKKYL